MVKPSRARSSSGLPCTPPRRWWLGRSHPRPPPAAPGVGYSVKLTGQQTAPRPRTSSLVDGRQKADPAQIHAGDRDSVIARQMKALSMVPSPPSTRHRSTPSQRRLPCSANSHGRSPSAGPCASRTRWPGPAPLRHASGRPPAPSASAGAAHPRVAVRDDDHSAYLTTHLLAPLRIHFAIDSSRL